MCVRMWKTSLQLYYYFRSKVYIMMEILEYIIIMMRLVIRINSTVKSI